VLVIGYQFAVATRRWDAQYSIGNWDFIKA
jgi:hypothetical protein